MERECGGGGGMVGVLCENAKEGELTDGREEAEAVMWQNALAAFLSLYF